MLHSPLRPFLAACAQAVRLPPRELVTTVHVSVVLVLVEVLIRWLPLPRLAALFGVRLDLAPEPEGSEQMMISELSPAERRKLRCTRRVADAWPFSKGPCLRRSLVAGHLLRRQRTSLRLGVAGTGDDIHAHAWLEIGGRPLEAVGTFRAFQHAGIGTGDRVADL